MNERKYPVIVSDFDGTLLRSDHTIAPETVESIRRFVDKGGVFVISTGRALQSILPIAQELGLKGLIAAFNGAVIADIESKKLLFKKVFSVQDGAEICKYMEEQGWNVQIYEIDKYYSSERTPYLDRYESIIKHKAVIPEIKIGEFMKKQGVETIKILSMMHPSERDNCREKIERRFCETCHVTSGASNLVEVCVKGFTKGTALEFLAHHYGVELQDILAIGDSLNDYAALAVAGKGIVVKNGESSLKEKFCVYGYSNDENAVGRIVEEYGYTGER